MDMGGGEIGLARNFFQSVREISMVCKQNEHTFSFPSSSNGGNSSVASDLWDGVGVERRIDGGDLRACYFHLAFLNGESLSLNAHKCIETLGCMYDRIRLLIFIRTWPNADGGRVYRVKLEFWSDLTYSSAGLSVVKTFSSRSLNLSIGFGKGTCSSVARPVSSMSVVSVPFDDGAMGEGSAMSLGLDTNGDD